MSEFPGRIELLTSDSTSKGAQSSQAAIFGAAAFPLLPLPSAKAKEIQGSVGIAVHRLHLDKHI